MRHANLLPVDADLVVVRVRVREHGRQLAGQHSRRHLELQAVAGLIIDGRLPKLPL